MLSFKRSIGGNNLNRPLIKLSIINNILCLLNVFPKYPPSISHTNICSSGLGMPSAAPTLIYCQKNSGRHSSSLEEINLEKRHTPFQPPPSTSVAMYAMHLCMGGNCCPRQTACTECAECPRCPACICKGPKRTKRVPNRSRLQPRSAVWHLGIQLTFQLIPNRRCHEEQGSSGIPHNEKEPNHCNRVMLMTVGK